MSFSTTNPESSLRFSRVTLLRFALPIVFSLTAACAVVCQEVKPTPESAPAKKTEPPDKQSKLPFTLKITDDQIVGVSLKAKDVPLKQIAAELARRLKTQVFVTSIMEKHLVTTNFSDLVLETALQMLAPQVYIDYEIDSSPGKNPRPVGIYLHGYNERPPADNAVVRGSSDVILIEGDTEDTGEPDEATEDDEELKVSYEKGSLTIRAKKEPLIAVLYGIANELGIPLEIKREIDDLVTVNIVKSSVESALQQLGPNIRYYLRNDLQLQEKRPLRLVLVAQDKKS